MVILGPSVLIAQYKTVSCPAPHTTHLSQVVLDSSATFLTIFGLLLTVLLFFTNLGSQNCPREIASKKGSWSAARDLHKRVRVPNHSFSIEIGEKPVAPPLDIPSRSHNRIGAARFGLVRVLFNPGERQ